MKTIIVGGVAAGTSVAAKLRRNSEEEEIVLYEKGEYISYSTCGMPYFLGHEEISRTDLTPRDPEWFRKRFAMHIQTRHEVLSIDRENKHIEVHNLTSGERWKEGYDRLVLATGSFAVHPKIEGIQKSHVHVLKHMEDAVGLDSYIRQHQVQTAVIIGSGFIGLEILENLIKRGIQCQLIEAQNHLLPALDADMSIWLEDYLKEKKISFSVQEMVSEIDDKQIRCRSGYTADADLVIVAAGVAPETRLAREAGIEIGSTGAIKVDDQMQTSVPDILAVGDCAESWSIASGQPLYRPMGSTANKTGRIAGDVLGSSPASLRFEGVLGTGILKFFDLEVGFTGLSHRYAKKAGYDCELIHVIKENQSSYLSEARQMVIKALADRKTGKLLGVQIIGQKGVDKRLDVFVTAMTFGATVKDLFKLDLCYAPPFSTTKDPVMYTGMILTNAIYHNRRIILPEDLIGREEEYTIIDVRSASDFAKSHIPTAVNIPLAELRSKIDWLKKSDKPLVTHCNKGTTGNAAQNVLLNSGFSEVYNISGGYKNYSMTRRYMG